MPTLTKNEARQQFIDYLNAPARNKTVTRGERIAWLVKCNGGFNVSGWGSFSNGGCWQEGLEQNDAIELIQYNAYFSAVLDFSAINPYEEFTPFFEKFVADQEAKYQKYVDIMDQTKRE